MASSIDFKADIKAVDANDKVFIFKGQAANPSEAGNYTVQQLLEYMDNQLNGMVAGYLDTIKQQRDEIDALKAEIQNMSRYVYVGADNRPYVNE